LPGGFCRRLLLAVAYYCCCSAFGGGAAGPGAAAVVATSSCGTVTIDAVDLWSAGCDTAKERCWKDVQLYANATTDPADCCAKCKADALCNGFTLKNTSDRGFLCLLKSCSSPAGAWSTGCPTTPSSPLYPTQSAAVQKAPPMAAGSALIQLDPQQLGPLYEGLGGVSAGTGPRLLVDYPAEAREAVLDYLFLPNFGASLQALKLEIGGGGDSTQGTEASHEPERGELRPKAGYELWLAAQAKRRNPTILIYGLVWNWPAWVITAPEGAGAAGAKYLADWVEVAASQNVSVDVLGCWRNESPFNGSRVVGLRKELDRRGYGHVRLAVGELRGGQAGFGDVPAQIAADSELLKATDIVALHYATSESPPSLNLTRWNHFWALNKSLWASEDYSTYSDATGGKCLAKLFNRNWVDGNITATFVWDLFWASFDGLACSGQGLIWCAEPWTGRYGVPDTIWAAAHTTQFADNRGGWHYVAKRAGGSGYLPGRLQGTTGGTFVSLTSNDTLDVTIVFETMDNQGSACAPGNSGWHVAAQETNAVHVCLAHSWCLARKMPPIFTQYRTNVALGERFVPLANVTADTHCCFSANITANSIYTFSTKHGAKKGFHPGGTVHPIAGANAGCGVAKLPLAAPFPFPYNTSFNEPDRFRDFPRFLSDLNGVFRVVGDDGGRLRQQMLEPSSAFGGVYPTSVLGSKNWANFSVAVDVMLARSLPANATSTHYAGVVARIGHGYLFGPPGGYALQLAPNGTWQLLAHPSKTQPQRVLASGLAVAASPRGAWQELRLSVVGTSITASINGAIVGQGIDSLWSSGLAGLNSGFHLADFKNFRVDEPVLRTVSS
jgi:galactosylceramidase